jgi:hypothetical protein
MEAETTANKYSESLTDIAQLKLQLRDSSKTSQNQELSLRQHMAWEIVLSSVIITKEDTTHIDFGVAYDIVKTFLNYKGGDDD